VHWHLLLLLAQEASTKERLVHWIAEYSYVGVFLFLVACGLGFPSPEEVALIGGGYAVFKQVGDDPATAWPWVLLMVSVAMAGVLVGDIMLWLIGRRVGQTPHKLPIIGRHLTPGRMKKARALFRRHGAKAVFFGRFLFGVRAVTFFVSGSLRVPFTTFVMMDGLAALISVPISVVLAWYFGSRLDDAFAWIKEGNRLILTGVAVAFLIVVLVVYRRRKELSASWSGDASADDADPLPAGPGGGVGEGDPAAGEADPADVVGPEGRGGAG